MRGIIVVFLFLMACQDAIAGDKPTQSLLVHRWCGFTWPSTAYQLPRPGREAMTPPMSKSKPPASASAQAFRRRVLPRLADRHPISATYRSLFGPFNCFFAVLLALFFAVFLVGRWVAAPFAFIFAKTVSISRSVMGSGSLSDAPADALTESLNFSVMDFLAITSP